MWAAEWFYINGQAWRRNTPNCLTVFLACIISSALKMEATSPDLTHATGCKHPRLRRQHVPLKCWFIINPHGATSQKMAFFKIALFVTQGTKPGLHSLSHRGCWKRRMPKSRSSRQDCPISQLRHPTFRLTLSAVVWHSSLRWDYSSVFRRNMSATDFTMMCIC
jgi:hypothetical protein